MKRASTWLALTVVLASGDALASGRRFTYTYESLVLNPGDIEIEPWVTIRTGREHFYTRFDHRMELELGLSERLQTALYLNWTALARDVVITGSELERESEFEWGGISNEWKLKLLDPAADAIGLALYAELSLAPTEIELEGKVIVDKRVSDLLFALNLVGEYEIELESADETESESTFEVDAAIAYLAGGGFAAGIELQNQMAFHEGLEHSPLFVGPVVSYMGSGSNAYWIALTALAQVADLAPEEGQEGLNLTSSERFRARLILGIEL